MPSVPKASISQHWIRDYSVALLAVAVAVALRWISDPWFGNQLPFAFFLIAAALVASWSGLGPSLFALVLGGVCAALIFSSLRLGPAVQDPPLSPLVVAAIYFLIGLTVIWVCASARSLRRRLAVSHEEAIRYEKTNAHLAAIVTSSEDAIISKDLNGIITSWNRSAERMFGYNADEAIGQPITLLIPSDHSDEEPGIIARIRRGETIDHYETERRRKDGSLIDISLTVSPIRNSSGVIVGASKVVRDVTASKRAEAALKQSEQQARNALVEAENAGRTKDEFLALLSHELRTPMSAILGWARLLRAGLTPEEMTQGVEVIERNARLQAQIIEDLLDMSRIVSGKFRLDVQTVNVGALVEAAVDAVRLAAEAKDLHLTLVCDPRIDEIRGDPSRLQQVFFNLLSNATKFTPRGGIVQVTCQRAGSNVEIAVSDSGMGIKAEFLPHVFERFRQQDGQTTRVHQGLGLGLAIVKHLVELHGGSVRAASGGDGKGATFTVLLPISIALTPYASSDWSTRRDHPSAERWLDISNVESVDAKALAGITVMVTDDEADARELLRKMLERRGAKVLLCGSAIDTMDRLQRHRPDVLICDIGMPGIDGYGLISRVRSFTPERGGATPAIALTAFARSEDRTRSLLAGFQMHLAKPVEPEELIASIRTVAMVA